MKIFTGSFIFAGIAVGIGYWIGGWAMALTVIMLSLLELVFSIDNSVVNATILKHWNARWRMLFLTVGIIIAVFGMRLLFPLMIVGVVASMGPMAVLNLALTDPVQYGTILTSAHHQIAGFGGAFLMLVFLKFFIDNEKDSHWIPALEPWLAKLGKSGSLMKNCGITVGAILLSSLMFDSVRQIEFIVAAAVGIATYVFTKMGSLFGDSSNTIVKQGIGGFLYLEALDSSFSLDSVIGAFAITNHIVIIMLGLGVGAMFVRSITIQLLEKGTLDTYQYLEHSAFWSIGALAVMMLISPAIHIPEVVAGLIGISIIAVGVITSIIENRRIVTDY